MIACLGLDKINVLVYTIVVSVSVQTRCVECDSCLIETGRELLALKRAVGHGAMVGIPALAGLIQDRLKSELQRRLDGAPFHVRRRTPGTQIGNHFRFGP